MVGRTRRAVASVVRRVGLRSGTERTRLGGVAAVVTASALVGVAGLPGLAAGVGVLVGWYLFGATYAFALGHVGVGSLLAGAPVLELAAVEVGLLGVLVARAPSPERRHRTVSRASGDSGPSPSSLAVRLLVLAWTLAGGALAWAAARSVVGVAVAAVLLVVATGLAAYGLHRYQLVSLGVVGDGRE